MRAVQITRFGGSGVFDVVDVPEGEARPDQKVYDVSTARPHYADTHQWLCDCGVDSDRGRSASPQWIEPCSATVR